MCVCVCVCAVCVCVCVCVCACVCVCVCVCDFIYASVLHHLPTHSQSHSLGAISWCLTSSGLDDDAFCLEPPTLRSFIFPSTESAISPQLLELTQINRVRFVQRSSVIGGCLAGPINALVAATTRGTALKGNNIQLRTVVWREQSICVPTTPAKFSAHMASDRVVPLQNSSWTRNVLYFACDVNKG